MHYAETRLVVGIWNIRCARGKVIIVHEGLTTLLTEVNWLFFTLIGIGLFILIGLGLVVVKVRGTSGISNLVVGLIGAVLGGLLLQWANLFPYSLPIGACVGAILLLIIKQAFLSNW